MVREKRVLVIDDDADFIAGVRSALEAEGCEVFTAADGREGLARAREVRPDLLVLDVMMRTRDEGFEVSRKLKQAPELAHVPVILVTGIRKAMELPFGFSPDEDWLPVRAVLEKPVSPAHLVEEVRKALG